MRKFVKNFVNNVENVLVSSTNKLPEISRGGIKA